MFGRKIISAVVAIFAVGALACSEHGSSTLVQPDQLVASAIVTGPSTAVSIVIAIDSTRIPVGGSARASATVRDAHGVLVANPTITWTSSNGAVASVSPTGVISGLSAGTSGISVTFMRTVATANVTVTGSPVNSIGVSFGSPTISVGTKTIATAVLRDAAGNVLTGRAIAWTSTAPLVASVSPSGDVLAMKPGTAVIAATSESKLGHATVTVSSPDAPAVASVGITLPVSTLAPGQTAQAVVVLQDASGKVLTGRTVTWSSSASGTATVSATGLVTAIVTGTASITATSEGKSANTPISVTPPLLRSITFDGYSSTAAMVADCTNFDCTEQNLTDDAGVAGFTAGDVTLDASATPPGGTKAMRYHYVHPSNGCNSITLRRSIRFPARQEVWAEFLVKWSANFTTRNDICPPNDHKLIFGDTQADGNGRWVLYVGSDAGAAHTIKQEVPTSPEIEAGNWYLNQNPEGSNELTAEKLWNGGWHTIRLHMRASSSPSTKDARYQIWIDGVLKHDQGGFSTNRNDGTSGPDLIDGFSFSHNKDDGPALVDMYMWWGAIRVFGANPGW